MAKKMLGVTLGMAESYNRYSKIQFVTVKLSIPYIRQAIDVLDVDPSSTSPLIIADFGSAHGTNSIYAMKTIIDYLQKTKKYLEPPLVIHNDLPTNDWKSLFQVLADDNSYCGVACGRSFYEQCLPESSLSIGYSVNCIHWLSKKPCNISNHCMAFFSSGDELAAFKSQGHLDYIQFLERRSRELRPGGILILAIVCTNDQGQTGFEHTKDLLYKCAQALPLTSQELLDFTLAFHFRSYEECVDKEIFARCSLQLIKSDLCRTPSEMYEDLQKGQITLDQFARDRTQYVRCWSESALRQALEINKYRSKEEINQVLDQFWALYEREVRDRPHEHDAFIHQTYLILKKITNSSK